MSWYKKDLMAQRSCRRERKLAAPQHVVSQAREAAGAFACSFESARLIWRTEGGTPGTCHRCSHIVDVRERADDDIRAFRASGVRFADLLYAQRR